MPGIEFSKTVTPQKKTMKIKKKKKKKKSFDSNIMPPCWSSLMQKILRTIYVNSMWLHVTDSDCIKLRPENCSCLLENSYLKPIGFVGDQTPLKINNDIVQMTENVNEEESSESEDLNDASDDSDFK
ncbi:unnamed protein product [Psylliodes chrysocephalus]|uniref:Uncharacterized protein n=1 Tax=Psylliodes chrysocephalus TaxID=3402493 RepID=A0A9P0G2N8_9CUCU|nr:unnamed protein product [Psylliodes chrysocephala]